MRRSRVFLYFFVPDFFSSRISAPILNSVLTPGQERTQQTRIFCGKTLLLTSSGAGAQAPKPKNESPPAYIFRSQSASAPERQSAERKSASKRAQVRERMAETPSPFKENYPSPRTHHSLIGCSPWPSKGRVHVVENYSWHMRRLFVYHLEHRMSAPSCDGECGGGSQHLPLFF